ncbi:MAG: heparan-alpha-glucosaminide N-acetyltransferase domain-containing protein, partial [Candidatus Hermodarchaeota archaeon]|nr:heparan-alpha-glucosaminide N-acetyltransferase domain-containing protein [Candidatus Hermodarchaeota archaeon]
MTEIPFMVAPDGRFRSIDVLRGVALVFMVINHFGQTFIGGGYHSPLAAAILFFGIIPAPLFYIVSGISVVLFNTRSQARGASARQIWQITMLRGLLIMSLGYLFSVSMFGTVWWLDWSILQLIGLSLIGSQLALLLPPRYRLVLPIFFVLGAPFMRLWLNYDTIVGTLGNIHYSPPLTYLDHLSAILATGKAPIFPWLACPLIGTFIGEALINQPHRSRYTVYGTLSVGAVMCLIVLPLLLLGDMVSQYPLTNGFFALATGMALLATAIVLTTVDLWGWWNLGSRFFAVNGQIALISYIAHHLYGIIFFGVL